MQKAKLIVIEGADNAGKKTQTALLLERLHKEGKKVGTLDFPQYEENTFGKLIKECLEGQHGDFLQLDPKIASALYAADRFESKEVLMQLLEDTDVVVLDRYACANMLHQGAKIENEEERKELIAWLEHVEHSIYGLPKPDLTIVLAVSPEHSLKALAQMAEEGKKSPDAAERDREHQERVAKCIQWLSSIRENWITVQCSGTEELRTREDIHEEIYKIVGDAL